VDTEALFYRIINGYFVCSIENNFYKVYAPTINLKQKAYSLYLSVIEDNKFDTESWITQDMIDNLLKINKIWNDDLQKDYDSTLKNIEYAKIDLYLKYNNLDAKNKIKKLLKTLDKKINDLYNRKHYFDSLTLEYYSNSLKNQFLVMNSTYDQDDEKVFGDDINNVDTKLLESILFELYSNQISIDEIRTLAHAEIWKSYWDASKENLFGTPCVNWTDDQRGLINYSKMLDSIREHPECPDENIIKDDQALDGWILYQKQKNIKEKKKQEIIDKVGEKQTSNSKNKDYINETFIITDSDEEAKEIFELNDITTQKDIIATHEIVKEKGSIPWSEAKHFKRHINAKLNTLGKSKRN